jgi:mannose-6-phosphate isomerase
MQKIGLLQNSIQGYAWGSSTAIPELLGLPVVEGQPQAELWMGAHPKAPSKVFCDGSWRSLLEVTQENPEEVLGKETASRFSNKLPFLFKVLAAAKPLSIQAHPNREQAKLGFARENKLGIPLEALNRNYRDDNHKPEIICALTPFWALNGFRKIGDILTLLEKIQAPSLAETSTFLRDYPTPEGLKKIFHQLMTMEESKQHRIIDEAVTSTEMWANSDPVSTWMVKLNQVYPGDIGVLSVILLNLILLKPGEAMYLPAGELHAYLEGVGIELMANSDNVLRGGLTPKHIDVNELLSLLSFSDGEVDILRPEKQTSGEAVYPTETTEFILSVIAVKAGDAFKSARDRSVEVMICTEGEAKVRDLSDGEITSLSKGVSIVVPAAVEQYLIEGDATFYKATVPL